MSKRNTLGCKLCGDECELEDYDTSHWRVSCSRCNISVSNMDKDSVIRMWNHVGTVIVPESVAITRKLREFW